MEVPRICRLIPDRYNLIKVKYPDGTVSWRHGPNRPRFSTNGNGNGHHKEEDVLKNTEIIYQAPRSSS